MKNPIHKHKLTPSFVNKFHLSNQSDKNNFCFLSNCSSCFVSAIVSITTILYLLTYGQLVPNIKHLRIHVKQKYCKYRCPGCKRHQQRIIIEIGRLAIRVGCIHQLGANTNQCWMSKRCLLNVFHDLNHRSVDIKRMRVRHAFRVAAYCFKFLYCSARTAWGT
jgi:hypothetical protein